MKDFAAKLMVAAVLMFALSLPAYARNDKGSESKQYSFQLGRDDGFRAGIREGRDDSRRGVGYDPDTQAIKRAANGRNVKHQGDYKKGFREGYMSGYREGYQVRASNGRNRYPNTYPDARYPDNRYPDSRYPTGRYPETRYPDSTYPYPNGRDVRNNTAYDMGLRQGFLDGAEKGQSDSDKNRNPDLNRHDWYRDADHNYKSSYGTKRDFQAGYRQGFQQGYYENFRDYRRSTGGGSIWDQILGRRP